MLGVREFSFMCLLSIRYTWFILCIDELDEIVIAYTELLLIDDGKEINEESMKSEIYRKEILDYAISLDTIQRRILYEENIESKKPLNILHRDGILLSDAVIRQREFLSKKDTLLNYISNSLICGKPVQFPEYKWDEIKREFHCTKHLEVDGQKITSINELKLIKFDESPNEWTLGAIQSEWKNIMSYKNSSLPGLYSRKTYKFCITPTF